MSAECVECGRQADDPETMLCFRCKTKGDAVGRASTLPRRATDDEVRAWAERHDMGGGLSWWREVLEDAQTLCGSAPAPQADPVAVMQQAMEEPNKLTGVSVTMSPAPDTVDVLRRIVKCDDDAKAAHGNPRSNLNGYGLVDLFDCVGHPFGAGEHKQTPCRSNELDAALQDARSAIGASASDGKTK